jgi:hypothetical protein
MGEYPPPIEPDEKEKEEALEELVDDEAGQILPTRSEAALRRLEEAEAIEAARERALYEAENGTVELPQAEVAASSRTPRRTFARGESGLSRFKKEKRLTPKQMKSEEQKRKNIKSAEIF